MRVLIKSCDDGNYLSGDAVGLFSDDHNFGRYEQKSKYKKSFPAEIWPNVFYIINVDNCDKSDYTYLLKSEDSNYYIKTLPADSNHRVEIELLAETSMLKSEFDELIELRNA